MASADLNLADPRAYRASGSADPPADRRRDTANGLPSTIYHQPQPGARTCAADLQQGAADTGRRRALGAYPRARLLRAMTRPPRVPTAGALRVASPGRQPCPSHAPPVHLSCTSDVPASVAAILMGSVTGPVGALGCSTSPGPGASWDGGRDRLPRRDARSCHSTQRTPCRPDCSCIHDRNGTGAIMRLRALKGRVQAP